MTLIIHYLVGATIPENPKETQDVRKVATRYTLLGGYLFCNNFSTPKLKMCHAKTSRAQNEGVSRGNMRKPYRRTCPVLESLEGRIPLAHFEGRLDKLHKGVWSMPETRQLTESSYRRALIHLHSISFSYLGYTSWDLSHWPPTNLSSWSSMWNTSPKWIEAEPVAVISVSRVQSFLWKNIVCKFNIPTRLISDNTTLSLQAQGYITK